MAKVIFDPELCKGCGLCVSVCPRKILALSQDGFNSHGYHYAACADQPSCVGCAMCALMCPDAAIRIAGDDVRSRKGD